MLRLSKHNTDKAGNAKFLGFTYGHIAFASFIIAVITGILLALPYDVKHPYDSLTYMTLTNPGGVLFRNIHYWSAQLFLIFSVLHLYDHFKRSTEKKVKNGLWLRLTVSIFIIFFVMLTGFIIKGDADSLQARRIFGSLLAELPFFGKEFSFSLLGADNDFQILYVHHIATATIFLWIIIVEHAKYFWPKLRLSLYLIPVFIMLGYIFPPPLHDGLNPVVKGPWYFLGLQEILHWLSFPVISLFIALLFLILIYFLPKFNFNYSLLTKRIILLFTVLYGVLIIIGYYFRGENWQFVLPWNGPGFSDVQQRPLSNLSFVPVSELEGEKIPEVFGRREGCLFCHKGVKGFSPSHDPKAIGCVSCHLGNPFSLNKENAHSGMLLIPGNLNTAKRTCGTANCHSEIADRLQNTIMTTATGIVSVDRYVFNEEKTPDHFTRISDIGYSTADTHLRNLCASCHLDGKKTDLGPITQLSRGGGCNACHLNYSPEALAELLLYSAKGKTESDTTYPKLHPSLSLNISNDHCFGCHSRSGRISTNYEGWHETLLNKDEISGMDNFRVLEDDRVFTKVQDDIHHEKGMSCIDCHTSRETMGNGKIYLHQEDQTTVQCTDCHFNGKPNAITATQIDAESQKILNIRKFETPDSNYLVVQKSGYPLVNTYINQNDKPELITKLTRQKLPLKPPAFVCTEGKAHSDLSCSSCHTSWAPQCITCHTNYQPNGTAYDLLANKEVKGEWVEYPAHYLAERPALGIRTVKLKDGKEQNIVDTFIPGMVLSIEKNGINQKSQTDKNVIFKRLYAPTFSHTIVKEGRDCKSCHNNSLAIGYGRGEMKYVKSGKFGKWEFIPKYKPNSYDGLPEDAWIGFLEDRGTESTTRSNTRPFNVNEQKKILTAGACLTCHTPESKPMKKYLETGKMPEPGAKCIPPRWN